MSARADHVSIAKTPLWRRRQFWRVVLPVLAVLSVIASGLIVFDAVDGSNGVDVRGKHFGVTYPEPPKPKHVKLEPAAEQVDDQVPADGRREKEPGGRLEALPARTSAPG